MKAIEERAQETIDNWVSESGELREQIVLALKEQAQITRQEFDDLIKVTEEYIKSGPNGSTAHGMKKAIRKIKPMDYGDDELCDKCHKPWDCVNEDCCPHCGNKIPF